MTELIIYTGNASILQNNEVVVYSGKNGFTTDVGTIPVICTGYTANLDSIVFTLRNIHLLNDDNYQVNVLEVPSLLNYSNNYIKVPISQYATTTADYGTLGFFDSVSNASLEVSTYNVSANTITAYNKNFGEGSLSDILPPAPFCVTIAQPILSNNFSNRTAYITGSYRNMKKTYNVSNISGSYTVPIGLIPFDKRCITVLLDDKQTTNFTWNLDNTISLSLNNTATKLVTTTSYYTVPAIEVNDSVSLSIANNSFSIVNTSYSVSDGSYDADLTSNNYYKIKLNKGITSNIGGLKLLNISADLEAPISNVTSNSFTIPVPSGYPFSYSLANNNIYYLYQKNKVKYTTARLDEFNRLKDVNTKHYVVEATNINRYNRASSSIKQLLEVTPIALSKITSIEVSEQIFIDTTGGASITATVTFPIVKNRDVTSYEIRWRVQSETASVAPNYSKITVDQPDEDTNDEIIVTIPGLNRGRVSGSNTLQLIVTPITSGTAGYEFRFNHSLLGKQINPSGLSNLNVGQQGNFLIYNWQFQLTTDGYILDLDTKEVEIRQYPGIVDLNTPSAIEAAWGASLIIDRIPFPNTTFTAPINRFGNYTYLLRVRDTSDNESDLIAAAVVETTRPSNLRVFKSYNERDPGTSYIIQDNAEFPTSNVNPEASFPSYSEVINGGLILSDSSNADNSNGSATSLSIFSGTDYLTTASNPSAEYITQIRDMGQIVKGTIRVAPTISISNPGITYASFYNTIIEGETDNESTSNVIIDQAFGGIGTILGFNNVQAATVTYDSYHKTLVSGGLSGNVYAIRNPGQFVGDYANANSYALIAGVINANAIALGAVYYANGNPSGSNNFSNLSLSGNSYQLVNLQQFNDEAATVTFLGPDRSIVSNIFLRYATDNVFYDAASNGIVGYPNHGNTNPNAFVGASNNAALGFKNYIPAEFEFRYMQLKLEILNPQPSLSEIIIENLTYDIDLQEKSLKRVVPVDSIDGVVVDYAYQDFIASPAVSVTVLGSSSLTAVTSNISNVACNVQVFDTTTGIPVSTASVSLVIEGV